MHCVRVLQHLSGHSSGLCQIIADLYIFVETNDANVTSATMIQRLKMSYNICILQNHIPREDEDAWDVMFEIADTRPKGQVPSVFYQLIDQLTEIGRAHV